MANFKNLVELDGFLGVAGYYRWFIADFSIIAIPLYRLNKKGEKLLSAREENGVRKAEALPHKCSSSRLPRLLTWGRDLHTRHWCQPVTSNQWFSFSSLV